MLERTFALSAHGTDVRTEVIAGFTTFLTMAYIIFVSLFRLREWIVNAIPRSLKFAISAGIGLFLAIIGLKNAGIIAAHPATLVTLGDIHQPGALLAVAGFLIIVALEQRKVPGAIIIGILAVTIASALFGLTTISGIVATPPSLAPTFMQMDIAGAFEKGLLVVILTFFMVELFDASGTLVGVAHRAGLLDQDRRLPRLKKALLADSAAIVAGAGAVPAYATAPALCYVAVLMARGLAEIDWDDLTETAPAVITAITMPFTFSIAHGIAFGFIAYTVLKLFSGRLRELSPVVAIIAAVFVFRFAFMV